MTKFHKPFWLIGAVAILAAIFLSSCNLGAEPVPTVDSGAIQTQAFSIVLTEVSVQQTMTALAIPPTAMPTQTPFPTATLIEAPTFAPIGGGLNTPIVPLPGFTPLAAIPSATSAAAISTVTTKNGCNDGLFIEETRPFDGAQMKPGEDFSKGWSIKNTGTCVWDEGYGLVLSEEYTLNVQNVKGEVINVILKKPEDFVQPNFSQLFFVKLTAPTTPGEYRWYWKLRDDGGNLFGPLVSVVFVVVK